MGAPIKAFFAQDDEWVNATVQEYVDAATRNERAGKPKHTRGMYRFTWHCTDSDEEEEMDSDYFSEGMKRYDAFFNCMGRDPIT